MDWDYIKSTWNSLKCNELIFIISFFVSERVFECVCAPRCSLDWLINQIVKTNIDNNKINSQISAKVSINVITYWKKVYMIYNTK